MNLRLPLCRWLVAACLTLIGTTAYSQLPSYTGGAQANMAYHDGRLRWAVGVQNVQVVRSAPDNPQQSDGYAATYRHHQMICYWGGALLGHA